MQDELDKLWEFLDGANAAAEHPDADRIAAYGALSFVYLRSERYRAMPLAQFRRLIQPPIDLGFHKIFEVDGVPRAAVLWPFLNPETERRFVTERRLDPGGGNDFSTSDDNYVYAFDLTSTPSLFLGGSIQAAGGSISNPSHTYSAPAGGFTFTAPATSGVFNYTVDRADLIANGITSIQFTVTGDWTAMTGSPASGTDTDTITFNFIICFAEGTRIATPDGEVAVEALRISTPRLIPEGLRRRLGLDDRIARAG